MAFYKSFVKNESYCLLLLVEVGKDKLDVDSEQFASWYDA
jgi:hypothetical protein